MSTPIIAGITNEANEISEILAESVDNASGFAGVEFIAAVKAAMASSL